MLDVITSPWLVLLLLSLLFYSHARSYWATVDDAFIAYRYAENFSNGLGLVFNEGEYVEGYTDFLWVILLAGFHLLGAEIVICSQILGVLFGVLLLPLLYFTGKRCCGLGRWASLAPCIVVVSSAAFCRWAGAGLETVPYATLFTASLTISLTELRHQSRVPISGVLWGLTALFRPEAIGLFIAFLVFTLGMRKGRPRTILAMVAGFGIIIIPHFIFRQIYYGFLLPNTFYAKVSLNPASIKMGTLYVGGFLLQHGPWGLLALLGLSKYRDKEWKSLLVLPLGVVSVAFLYIISVGGDFYNYFRFCIPYFPWIVLLICTGSYHGGKWLLNKFGSFKYLSLEFLLLGFVAISIIIPAKLWPDSYNRDFKNQWEFSNNALERYGRWLGENKPRSTVLAATWLGRIAYFSGFHTIDMLGIADLHIAHSKPRSQHTALTAVGQMIEFIGRDD